MAASILSLFFRSAGAIDSWIWSSTLTQTANHTVRRRDKRITPKELRAERKNHRVPGVGRQV